MKKSTVLNYAGDHIYAQFCLVTVINKGCTQKNKWIYSSKNNYYFLYFCSPLLFSTSYINFTHIHTNEHTCGNRWDSLTLPYITIWTGNGRGRIADYWMARSKSWSMWFNLFWTQASRNYSRNTEWNSAQKLHQSWKNIIYKLKIRTCSGVLFPTGALQMKASKVRTK